jgi:transcriptional regulator with XRE-family HTH domain
MDEIFCLFSEEGLEMTLATTTFPERAKTARLLRGISQRELAKEMRLPHRTICRWETGQSKPFPSNSKDLAKALRVSLRWLITGQDPMEASASEEQA